MLIERGTLRKRVEETTEQALSRGALVPVPTNYMFVEEGAVRYFVRVLERLKRKDEERKKQEKRSKKGEIVNPFLPPEPELTVGDVTESHIAVLNKFNVLTHHLLIVTRHFEDQDMLLTPGDFEALWLCLLEYDSLGFYNGGRDAGASQQHKHLQVVPLPLAPEGPEVPISPLLEHASGPGLALVPGFPFRHSFVRFQEKDTSDADAARRLYSLYSSMLKEVGMKPPVPGHPLRQSFPYCLLVTRQWMLLVPRSREFFENISLNSLAFAGSFFVRDEEQLLRLKTHGIMSAMRAVTVEDA